MKAPKLEKIVTNGTVVWRVCYLGMTRDFSDDYAAVSFYEHLCQCYVHALAQKRYR